MTGRSDGGARGVVPLSLLGAVVALCAVGIAQGLWLTNLHNGLLAVAFAAVGSYVLHQRPGHREGRLFLATGLVEAVIFAGRQVAHADPTASPWWGWLGVWLVAIGLGLVTIAVLCFPDGRLPSRRWRPVATSIVAVVTVLALLSALWPVEYEAASVGGPHPFTLPGGPTAQAVWSAVAHPVYALLQALWVVALVVRWRVSGPVVRRQLLVLAVPVAGSVIALLIGLAVWGSPNGLLLATALVPVGAGWAIVHGQHLVAYGALSWLSRAGGSADLPTDLARAVAEAMDAPAVVWVGDGDRLDAIGVWPASDTDIAPTPLAALAQARPVRRDGEVVGAISVTGADLTRAQDRLLDDLAAQAAVVIARIPARSVRLLDGLTPREQQVLELMARGYTNAAICAELHLSVKTVEPAVSRIFDKLGLQPDAASNRRVLAVVAYLDR